jgi:hypothetical protein
MRKQGTLPSRGPSRFTPKTRQSLVRFGEEAKALCLAHKGTPLPGQYGRLWEGAIVQDFAKFRKAGGLTARRHASGEIDWTGRISKCGDAMLRTYLFEGIQRTADPRAKMVGAEGLGG